MKSNEQFNALHGVNNVSRSEVNDIIELAKQENNSAVIYRLSRILNRFENDEYFDFEIANYSQSGLNGAQHTGNYKDALDDCGRLKKGYKFQGGTVVKVAPKVKKVAPVKKTASNYGKKTKVGKETKSYSKIVQGKIIETTEKMVLSFDSALDLKNYVESIKGRKSNNTAINTDLRFFVPLWHYADDLKLWFNYNKKSKYPYEFITLENVERPKVSTAKNKTASNYGKKTKRENQNAKVVGYLLKDNISGETIASKKTLLELEKVFYSLLENEKINNNEVFVYEIVKKSSKNIQGKRIFVDWVKKEVKKGGSNKPTKSKSIDEVFDFNFTKPFSEKTLYEKASLGHDLSINSKELATAYAYNQFAEYLRSNQLRLNLKIKNNTTFQQSYSKDLGLKLKKELDKRNVKVSIDIDLSNYKSIIKEVSENVKGEKKTKKTTKKENSKSNRLKVDANGQTALFGVKKTEKLSSPVLPFVYVPRIDAGNIKTVGKIKSINDTGREQNNFFTVNGQVGKFLQQVERKPFESVVITLDGMQGAGKTTTLYKFIDAFASAGNSSLFISGEEHPESSLAVEKRDKYLSAEAKRNTSIVGDVESIEQLYQYVKPYDIIFIDSWQKLQRMVGNIRLDEDLRKKFNGKVFVVIFQQTTTGRTKGGAEVVFDGDIIIKMVKEPSFSDNYAFFDKNRYTKIPIENIRYNIASGKTYNPNAPQQEELQPTQNNEFSFNIK